MNITQESIMQKKKYHLVVLQNGFNGNSWSIDMVKRRLLAELDEQGSSCSSSTRATEQSYSNHGGISASDIRIVISPTNIGSKSWDGIIKGSIRLANYIQSLDDGEYDRISLIGLSLGGVYVRVCAKLLHERGVFNNMTPKSLITISSPHCGIRNINVLFKSVVGFTQTGKELLFADDTCFSVDNLNCRDTLLDICDDEYISALNKFQSLTVYGNISGDSHVPLHSSCILNLVDVKHIIRKYSNNTNNKIHLFSDDEHSSSNSIDCEETYIVEKMKQISWRRKMINIQCIIPSTAHFLIMINKHILKDVILTLKETV